jgi:hypothetical protein
VVLSGWKEIAAYLGCGMRTAQGWENKGLPVRRPNPGRRAHVMADSERLDFWIQHGAFWRAGEFDVLGNIEPARKLRGDVQQARQNLHLKMADLRKEVEALRKNRRKQQTG